MCKSWNSYLSLQYLWNTYTIAASVVNSFTVHILLPNCQSVQSLIVAHGFRHGVGNSFSFVNFFFPRSFGKAKFNVFILSPH